MSGARPFRGLLPAGELSITGVRGIPEVRPGDDLAALVAEALERGDHGLRPFDILVVTHKVVSKAEGALVELGAVEVGEEARSLAAEYGGDERLVAAVLAETRRVVRVRRGALVCETHHGLVCANAGVDRSNTTGPGVAVLLPRDPDASARRLHRSLLLRAGGGPLGVVISDTFGRPFRMAGVNVAIGVCGLPALTSHTGAPDAHGYVLQASDVASADELASAAELVMGKLDAVPVALVRGLRWSGEGTASELLRDAESDIFRR